MQVLIDYRPALRDRTGVGEATHQLVKALLATFPGPPAGERLDLTIFSSSWKDRLAPGRELAGAATVDRRIPVRLLNLAWHRLEWPSAELLTGAVFDVVHSPHPLLLPAHHAAQVITIHDLYFLDHPERTRAEIRRDYPTLVRDHARRADRIIVPSQSTARDVVQRLGVSAEMIAVCPHGAPEWSPRPAPPTEGYILFMGTLEPRKNVGGLLDAYERLLAAESAAGSAPTLPRIPELVLAGQSNDDARSILERLGRAPLAGRVKHIGYVDPGQRYALYAGARLLVQPSFDEGFGMPVLEAMATGVPVVASNRGALPEIVGDAGSLVSPDAPDALAAAIARMLTDEGYARSCMSKGILRALQFDWTETAHRVYAAYRAAVARHQSRNGRVT